MGWVEKVPGKHSEIYCIKPVRKRETDFGPGSVWECDDCGRCWLYEGERDNPDGRSDPREPLRIPVWTQCVKPVRDIGLYAPGTK